MATSQKWGFVGIRIPPESKLALEEQALAEDVSLNTHLAELLNCAAALPVVDRKYRAQRKAFLQSTRKFQGVTGRMQEAVRGLNEAESSKFLASKQPYVDAARKIQGFIDDMMDTVDSLMDQIPPGAGIEGLMEFERPSPNPGVEPALDEVPKRGVTSEPHGSGGLDPMAALGGVVEEFLEEK